MVSVPHEASDEVLYRQYDYDEETVIVADLGRLTSEASVDVVDETAIVVVEIDGQQRQYEFDLPSEDAHTFISNGVLTIEVGEA
ncbi:MAG: Hsp20/alpha crystallin family protein [Halanaeroarchaeum sp.]